MLKFYSHSTTNLDQGGESLADCALHAPWIDETYPPADCWVVYLCDDDTLTPWSVRAPDLQAAIAVAKAEDRDWRYQDGAEIPEDWESDTDVMRVYQFARLGVLCAEDREWPVAAAGHRGPLGAYRQRSPQAPQGDRP